LISAFALISPTDKTKNTILAYLCICLSDGFDSPLFATIVTIFVDGCIHSWYHENIIDVLYEK